MMLFLAITISTVLACEILFRSPLFRSIREIERNYRKIGKLFASSQISDHWKEQMMPAYAMRVVAASFGFLLWIAVVLAVALAGPALLFFSLSRAFETYMQWEWTLYAIFVSIIWVWLRKRIMG